MQEIHFPAELRRTSLLRNVQISSEGQPGSYSIGTRSCFAGEGRAATE